MNVMIGACWQHYLDALVETGRYGSAEDVVSDALTLFKDHEVKLQALRDKIEASIARGGSHTSEEVSAYLEARMDEWEREQQAHSAPAAL